MAEAFGVEQGIQITPRGAPTGNTAGIITPRSDAAAGITKGISDFIDEAMKGYKLKRFSDDLTGAQTHLESIAAGGNAAELLREKRKLERELFDKHPEHRNEIPRLLDQFGKVKTQVSPDGQSLLLVDEEGNIHGQGPRQQVEDPISSNPIGDSVVKDLQTGMPTFEVEFPRTAKAAEHIVGLINKQDGGLNNYDVVQVGEFLQRANSVPGRIDQTVSRFRLSTTRKASSMSEYTFERDRAVSDITASVLDGLNAFDVPIFHDIVSNPGSAVTPNLVTNMMHQYVNDIMTDMTKDGTFALLGIKPQEFQAMMRTVIDGKNEVLRADFSKDADVINRTHVIANLRNQIIKNNMWHKIVSEPGGMDMLETATRLEILEPAINLFNVSDTMTAIAGNERPGSVMGDLARRMFSFAHAGIGAADPTIGVVVPPKNWADRGATVNYVKGIVSALDGKGPYALNALVRGLEQAEALQDAVLGEKPEEGKKPIYTDQDKALVRAFVQRLKDMEKAALSTPAAKGKTLKQIDEEGRKAWGTWSDIVRQLGKLTEGSGTSTPPVTRPRPTQQ